MAGRGYPGLSVLLAAAVVMYPLVGTDTARGAVKATPKPQAKPQAKPQVTVKVGVLKGTLLDTMGDPVGEVTITVLARGGKVVATAVSGKDGTFSTKKLAAGDYTLKVGKKSPLALKVAKKADLSHLLIIIPAKAKRYSAGAPADPKLTWIVVGAVVVATAVALPLSLSGDDETTTTTATTTTPLRRPRRRVSP